VATIVDGDFEWDDDKAASNLAKHGVSFPEAATASSTSCTLSKGDAIASSALDPQLAWRGMSTSPEVRHDALG
jgi:uncharacterized DUF497 family protein